MDRRCIKCYARLRGTNIRIQHRTDKPVLWKSQRRAIMKKELLAEVEGRYVRSCCSIPKYGIVTLQIYRIDSQEIRFENHCPKGWKKACIILHRNMVFRVSKWSFWMEAGTSLIRTKGILCLLRCSHCSRCFRRKTKCRKKSELR